VGFPYRQTIGLIEGSEKNMVENIEKVLDALDVASTVIRDEFGDTKKANSHIGKIMAIQADYSAMKVKRDIMSSAPGRRKKKEEL
jgi:hypothetical protein